MLLRVLNFRLWMQERMGQRGAALVEYAILLAFVAIIGTVFITGDSSGSMADKIKAILTKIVGLLNTAATTT